MRTVPTGVNYVILDFFILFTTKFLIKVPACFDWTHDIVSPLNDDNGEMLNLEGIFNQLSIFHPPTMDKKVRFNSCKSQSPEYTVSFAITSLINSPFWILSFFDIFRVHSKFASCSLPFAPLTCTLIWLVVVQLSTAYLFTTLTSLLYLLQLTYYSRPVTYYFFLALE